MIFILKFLICVILLPPALYYSFIIWAAFFVVYGQ